MALDASELFLLASHDHVPFFFVPILPSTATSGSGAPFVQKESIIMVVGGLLHQACAGRYIKNSGKFNAQIFLILWLPHLAYVLLGRYRLLRQWAPPPRDGSELWWAKPRPGGGGEAVVVKTVAGETSDERAWDTFAREWGVLKYLQVWS